MGTSTALVSTLLAANARSQFLRPYLVIAVSMTAAALAFLVTTLNADLKTKGFGLAASWRLQLPGIALMTLCRNATF
jgi:hypothetical protein